MSIRFRVRYFIHGIPREEWRDFADGATVGQLVYEYEASQLVVPAATELTVVLFRGELVPTNRVLATVFQGVPEADRLLEIWNVPKPILDLLQRREEPEAEADFDDDAGDLEMALPQPPGRAAPAPPAALPPPVVGTPPAARAPAPASVAASAPPRVEARDRIVEKARSAPEESDEIAARRASVRYYDRMNPQKVFPFLVTLTGDKLKKIVQKGVGQTESKPFEVKLEEFVTVEPILPGCTCHPARAEVKLTAADTAFQFWVVPQVLGKVKGAKVCVSQEGRTLAEVELDIRVRRTTLAIFLALATLLYPVVAAVLRQYGIDFKNLGQLGDYLSLVNDYLRQVSPLAVFGGLAMLTMLLYWWSRPRRRDRFWDLETEKANR